MSAEDLELTLVFSSTNCLPKTEVSYRPIRESENICEARIRVGDIEHVTSADANLLELAFRYRQKRVSHANLIVNGIRYVDFDGDGLLEYRDEKLLPEKLPTRQVIAEAMPVFHSQLTEIPQMQWLYDFLPELSGEAAMKRAFIASCGSMASVVHEMRSHSILWAAIPSGGPPNEVHRHLGGNVYCLFYSGRGHLHRVDPENGFETVPIAVDDSSPFQLLTLPVHSWYQPINTGTTDLLYFMVHEPAFDRSELLTLRKQDCRADWPFEYA